MPEAPAGAAPLASAGKQLLISTMLHQLTLLVSRQGREGIAPRAELSLLPRATGFVRHTQAASRASGSKLPILATNPCLGSSTEKQGSPCDKKKPVCAAGVDASRPLPIPRRRRVGASWAGANSFCCRPDG